MRAVWLATIMLEETQNWSPSSSVHSIYKTSRCTGATIRGVKSDEANQPSRCLHLAGSRTGGTSVCGPYLTSRRTIDSSDIFAVRGFQLSGQSHLRDEQAKTVHSIGYIIATASGVRRRAVLGRAFTQF